MEGASAKSDAEEFTNCFSLVKKKPFILELALSAGIGGLLFCIRDDFKSVDHGAFLQEIIVSTSIARAIVGAAIGVWINDSFGWQTALLAVDLLFLFGAILMVIAPNPIVLIIGRLFVGFSVGMASMSTPLYILEAPLAKIRGALVSTNEFLIIGGQFLLHLINLVFTKAPGTWHWMLTIAGLLALLQFVLMWFYQNLLVGCTTQKGS